MIINASPYIARLVPLPASFKALGHILEIFWSHYPLPYGRISAMWIPWTNFPSQECPRLKVLSKGPMTMMRHVANRC